MARQEVGVTVFLGTHHPRLDEKGRLFLPAKFREKLASGVVIARGQDHCLQVFTYADFERYAETVTSAPSTNGPARNFARVLLSSASDEIPDKQGRITIPAGLREYAGLERECTVVGTGPRLEIWATDAWNALMVDAEAEFAGRTEEVIPGSGF